MQYATAMQHGLEFPEIDGQNLKRDHRQLSMTGNPKTMHFGVFLTCPIHTHQLTPA